MAQRNKTRQGLFVEQNTVIKKIKMKSIDIKSLYQNKLYQFWLLSIVIFITLVNVTS